MTKTESWVLPAEWHPQSGVMLTWPHQDTDWAECLEEAERCFLNIAREISRQEPLLIIAKNAATIQIQLDNHEISNAHVVELNTNDTWARDHGGITVFQGSKPFILDFKFNGWGLKFPANFDNLITRSLFDLDLFQPETAYCNRLGFVLEGGSVESDGNGTILTTAECLLSPNRNGQMNRGEIENYLRHHLGAKRVLWLEHGFLAGDDTDSHIDTLARFCDPHTIAYVRCTDPSDIHFDALQKMETQLRGFRTDAGDPYRLIPLPMADEIVEEGDRLPATYANFLIINGAVLLPVYGSPKDEIARNALQQAFPDRRVVEVDCRVLVKQHGSLHCVTMQFPEGVLRGLGQHIKSTPESWSLR